MQPLYGLPGYKKNCLLLCIIAGFVPLVFSGVAEYVFDVSLCHLCYLSRYPYLGIVLVALVALCHTRRTKFYLGCMAALALSSLGISIYQLGIEHSLWAGTQACGGDAAAFDGGSVAELEAFLANVPVRRCDQVQPLLGFISFASLNAAYSLLLLFYIVQSLRHIANQRFK